MQPSERRCQYSNPHPDSHSGRNSWQILVAGPDRRGADQAAMALQDLLVDNVPVEVFQAFSAKTARKIFEETPGMALLLLLLPPEKDREWIDLAAWVRGLPQRPARIAACGERLSPSREQELIENCHISDVVHALPQAAHPLRMLVIKALKTGGELENLAAPKPGGQKNSPPKDRATAFSDMMDTIGDLVWETGPDDLFSYISPTSKILWGYHAQTLQGRSFDVAMDRQTLHGPWVEIKKAMSERQPFTDVEISRTHKNGCLRYFLTSGRPLWDETGEWMGYRGVEKDITALVHSEQEKKKLIAQLRHAQRLEAMGSLAGGIAHDFNNILGGILGYTQLIQFEIKDNPVALAHTEHIIAGCNRAKNLILQILDFSRQRESTTPPKVTIPGEIVTEAAKLLRASIPSSIRLETEIQEDAGSILADGSQIHQAVMNLCTNARQAIETAQGCITISVRPLRLTPENHTRRPELDLDYGDYVTIAVTDTGRGIESNTLEKIFNPYFTTKKRGDGTGLGLSVVHGIVTRFNGIIRVETDPGRGSTFTLYFPRHRCKKPPEKETRIRLMEGKASVLFIDDEPMLVDIGKMMLEKLGYRVTAIETPLKGLEMIRSDPGRFDVVITDMTMPDILGTQLAAQAKQMNPDLTVVLATGFSNIVQTQKANPSGIDAVLPKPITMATLSQTLHQLLST